MRDTLPHHEVCPSPLIHSAAPQPPCAATRRSASCNARLGVPIPGWLSWPVTRWGSMRWRLTLAAGSNRRWPSELEQEFWDRHKRAHAGRRRISLLLAVIIAALFGIVDVYAAPAETATLWFIRFGILVPVILMLLAMSLINPLHRWSDCAVALGVVIAGSCVTVMTVLAPVHGTGILLVVFASYTFVGLRCLHAAGAGLAVTLVYVVVLMMDGTTAWPVAATNVFFLAACNVIGGFVCYVLEQAERREFSRVRVLAGRHQLSEHLLRKVLPVNIAARLKRHAGAIAEPHSDVTMLFADIVDFTSYAAATEPSRLIHVLDQLFTCFDQLSEAHGLEKIKTIGDAYMVAGGLRSHGADPVHAVAAMAQDMLAAVRRFDAGNGGTLALRVGIHTGPVIAGVVGRTKLAYDVWGDAVNIASRLQTSAFPGTIQVSESTYRRLRDRYVFSGPRLVSIKGRGEVSCYRLLACRCQRNAGDAARTVPSGSQGGARLLSCA